MSYRRKCHLGPSARRCTPSNLRYPTLSVYTDLEVLGGLWNCQSAVKTADSISAYASLQTPLPGPYRDLDHPREHGHSRCPLYYLLVFTHPKTIRVRRGDWTPHLFKVLSLEHLTRSVFELHAVTLPIKLYIAVIYRLPGPFRDFFDEMHPSAAFLKMAHHSLSWTSPLSAAKSTFYLTKINSSASNPRKLFSMFSSLLTPPPSTPFLPHS
ncbi:hypothetical protein N1851_019207 [Merluccius polli]|uniref:Uncharacterized protein n=1 Tax=Merluccius polli TaxID=89951 RepID=A0AA47MM04_MERPO|nr:hypothetical protein N1851_019207 [Merluccius polli]